MSNDAQDARFEDASSGDRPLRLRAESSDDLAVISSLIQDAVGKVGDISWLPKKRRLITVLNRFRWEAHAAAAGDTAPAERVRSAITVDGVINVQARGLNPAQKDVVYNLLALIFTPTEDGAGILNLTLAGNAELAVEVECLDLALADISQPWAAKSGCAPEHNI